MPSERIRRLSAPDQDLVARAFAEGVNGPYFPDWEIDIITAFTRDELRRVQDSWPEATVTMRWEGDPEQVQYLAVNAILNNLIGYPHGRWESLEEVLGVGSDALVDLLGKWRGGPVAGYWEAIE
jgi:hypothetical protein